MIGIICRPETLDEALQKEGMLASVIHSMDPFKRAFKIFESDAPDEKKLNVLLKNRIISNKDYRLLKRCISYEKTIPKKVVDYFGGFFQRWTKGEYVI